MPQIPDSLNCIPVYNSGTWILVFNCLVGFWIPWAVFQIPKPKILDSRSKISQNSKFYRQKFPRFWNQDFLTWGKLLQYQNGRGWYTWPVWTLVTYAWTFFYLLIYNKFEFSSLINDKSIGILQCMENLKKRREKTGYEIFRKEILLWHLVHQSNFYLFIYFFFYRIIQSRFIRNVFYKKKLILPPNLTRIVTASLLEWLFFLSVCPFFRNYSIH